MEDYVDLRQQLLHVFGSDGQVWLGQLSTDGLNLLMETGPLFPDSIEHLEFKGNIHVANKENAPGSSGRNPPGINLFLHY